jgi:hypothetical protein
VVAPKNAKARFRSQQKQQPPRALIPGVTAHPGCPLRDRWWAFPEIPLYVQLDEGRSSMMMAENFH